MKAVLQRVLNASVTVEEKTVGAIGPGLLLFLGIHQRDSVDQVVPLLEKCIQLRIFADGAGKMNRSLIDSQGGLLIVSQFTLYADCKSGRRPSFTSAAQPGEAEKLYEAFVEAAKERVECVETGSFGAHMQISLVNDGPVTMILELE